MKIQSAAKKSVVNNVAVELAWLAVSFAIAAAVCRYLFNWQFDKGPLNIQLYDTYFILSVSLVLFPVFFIVAFLLLFLKGVSTKFARPIANLVLLTIGLCLIGSLIFFTKEVAAQSAVTGWVIYPPLAAIPSVSPESNALTKLTNAVIHSLIALQLIVTIALGYVAFQWGKKTTMVS